MSEHKIKLINKLILNNYCLTRCEKYMDPECRDIYYKKCLEKGEKFYSMTIEFVELLFSEGRENDYDICNLLNWGKKLYNSKYRSEIYEKVKQEILRDVDRIQIQKIMYYCIDFGDSEFIYFFLEYDILKILPIENIIGLVLTMTCPNLPNIEIIKILSEYIFGISGSGEHFYNYLLTSSYGSLALCIVIDSYIDSSEYCKKIDNYLHSSNVCIRFDYMYDNAMSKENFILMSELVEKHKLNFFFDHILLLHVADDIDYVNEIVSRGYFTLDN